uniref:Phospholipase A2 n=1 Tax=Amazona collaria TaxID=241587 RepID=A0A8B9F335_9PSIT
MQPEVPRLLSSAVLIVHLSVNTVSQTDCYVKLWLPTASCQEARTRTVCNSRNPVWNETFLFMIQSEVKNILELSVCDEDALTPDDQLLTVRFDVAKVQPGEKVRLNFELDPEVRNKKISETEWVDKIVLLMGICPKLLPILNIRVVLTHKNFVKKMLLKHRIKCSGFRRDQKHSSARNGLQVTCLVLFLWSSCKSLDLRLGFDLCAEEQDFICKRKKVVAAALKNVLHLDEDLQEDEVPVVAIMTTAGGVRSMTAMFGSLLALQDLGVLDCISYISGLSATTWTMAKLYEDANWSQKDLRGPIGDIKEHVVKSKMHCFSLDHMKYYEKELCERKQEGHKLSFTDLWGLFIDCMLHHQKLSDQQLAVNQGQNPLPIYLSLNVKDDFSTLDFKEWMEFTPYEVGFLKYGAFVRSEDFGSEFYMGHLMKKIPESRICFLEGTWSNIFSQNFMDAVHLSGHSEDFWHRWTRDPSLPKKPHEQATCLSVPKGCLSSTLREMMTGRPVVSTYHNFLKGLQLHNKYLENERFCMWKGNMLDSSPNQLNERDDHLKLVDTAFFINTSCPPILRPERKVDVILHLNYSGGSQTLPLDLFSEYCLEHGIPFPSTELSQEDREHLKECYVFADSLEAPVLAYFPLVCDTFQKYKAPSVERSPSEMEEGRVDVSNCIAPYGTGLLTYSEENFNKFLNLCIYNILNNKHLILQALRTAVERKKRATPE